MKSLLLILLTSALSQAAIKSEVGQSDIEIHKIKEAISEERSQIVESEVKKRGILGSLYDINKTLGKLNSDIQNLEKQLSQTKKKIQLQTATIVALEKTRDLEKSQLAVRLRALYKIGFHGYAQMLLSSHSSMELARNVKFMKIMTEKDANLLTSYKENIFKIASEQIKMRSQIRTFIITQKTLGSNKTQYDEEKKNQVVLLSKIEKDKQTHIEALKEWREAAIKLEEKLKTIEEKNTSVLSEITHAAFFEKQGRFRPPVLRRITQKYGIAVNSKFDTKIFHKGLFFAAKPGDSVSALYDGKVVYAGWVNGFGNTLILDHGDHYYSLYAHNSMILKKAGDAVTQGEMISRSGDSGSLRGPGLYFEIRHFSESLDPLPWLDLKTVARL